METTYAKMGSFISDLLNKVGITQRDLSNRLKVSRQYVNAWVTGEQLPPAHRMAAIAKELGTTVEGLLAHIPENRQDKYRGMFESASQHHWAVKFSEKENSLAEKFSQKKKVPLLGFTEGTHPGLCKFDANNLPPVEEYVDAPPGGDGKEFYALRVKGSSMSPRYNEGDIVYFSPGVEVHSGEEAIVILEDGQCMLKRIKVTDDSVILISVQEDPIVVPRSKIRCMHRLMWVKR